MPNGLICPRCNTGDYVKKDGKSFYCTKKTEGGLGICLYHFPYNSSFRKLDKTCKVCGCTGVVSNTLLCREHFRIYHKQWRDRKREEAGLQFRANVPLPCKVCGDTNTVPHRNLCKIHFKEYRRYHRAKFPVKTYEARGDQKYVRGMNDKLFMKTKRGQSLITKDAKDETGQRENEFSLSPLRREGSLSCH